MRATWAKILALTGLLSLLEGCVYPVYYTQYPGPPRYPAPSAPRPVSLAEIKSMSKSGVSEDNIINQINNTHSVYHLDAQAIIDLTTSGVGHRVISTMINTGGAAASEAPPAPPAEAARVAPGPDYVWMNGEWVWDRASWVWVYGRWVVAPYPHAIWVGARWEHGPNGWQRVPGYWR
jgi:hypothetical protein